MGEWHMDKNVTMFGDDPDWLDINNYGYEFDWNAYILASASSLAEFPTRVRGIF
jgi:hypothetical protein